ncbi:hypothetical protein V5799_015399, partial [Amblyomma americanum]
MLLCSANKEECRFINGFVLLSLCIPAILLKPTGIELLSQRRIGQVRSSQVESKVNQNQQRGAWCTLPYLFDMADVGADVSAPKKARIGFEQDVGITEYVGTHKGFNGILKQRYSDFLVNEIDPSGRVVRLETLEPPPEPEPDTGWAGGNVSAEDKEQLELLAGGKRTEPVVLPAAGLSKEQR